ncbi:hypothetical protein [Bradyrhizobium ottawaense]|uniref:hypothetical protein n=1 Tax=Bradyrhizobium ottawaense TaxID=931866 RepID=UPI0030F45608
MKKKLSQSVLDDLTDTAADRVKDVLSSILQLVDDDEQRAHVMLCIAALCAHDAAHTLHDAKQPDDLALAWAVVVKRLAGAMCPTIANAVKGK